MATPKTLKEITEKKALDFMSKHNGSWENGSNSDIGGDWVCEDGRKTKWGRRMEMLRLTNICGRKTWEWGVVSN